MLQSLFSIKHLAPSNKVAFEFTPVTNAVDIKKQINLKLTVTKRLSLCSKDILFLLICFLLSFASLHQGYEKINANIIATDEWMDDNKFRHLLDSKMLYGLVVSSYHMSQGISSILVNIFIHYTYQEIGKKKLLHVLITLGLIINLIGAGMCVGSHFWTVYLVGNIFQGVAAGMNSILISFLIKFYIVDDSTLYLSGIGINLCSMNIKNGTMTGYIILYCCKKWYKGTRNVWVYPNISAFVFTAMIGIGLLIFNFYYLPYYHQSSDQPEKPEEGGCEKPDTDKIFFGQKKTILLGLVVLALYSVNSLNYFLYYNNKVSKNLESRDYKYSGLVYATFYTVGGNLSTLLPYDSFVKNFEKNAFRVYKNTVKYVSFVISLGFIIIVSVGYGKRREIEDKDNKYLKTVFSFGVFIVFLQIFFLEIPLNYILIHMKIMNSIDLFQLIAYASTISDVVILLISPVLDQSIGYLMCLIFGISAMLLALIPM